MDEVTNRLEAARTIELEIARHQAELRVFEQQFAGLRELRDELRGMVRDAQTVVGVAGVGANELDRAMELVVASLNQAGAAKSGASEHPAAVERLAQEVLVAALLNIANHSGATESNFSVKREESWLFVSVFDNGNGSADPGRGSSLRLLRERVDALGGHFSLSSPPGRGTLLTVGLPCT
jgi:signal transduction histidine kinase